MGLLIDLVLLLAGLVLWMRSSSEGDDVWSLFLRVLVCLDLVFLTIGNGQLLLELPLLGLALALPSVQRLEQREREAR
ncbi:hypothetical protein [Vulcanococcus limneticus]|uniref:hypothetical protein n=1 Tax=Vulcanococcus limneticus TaxID=2170428 RepID=UPI000B991AD1|nr:hypothetical protein [Vulcanococcus limneticus]MCP9791433.1 hypothetical protein [Vulcanococcus limneticus MW73D5]MCP9893410.1 hypothetical protein [Vulcanococcus limneticus Candia 3F8]MCP9896778.1 hypothetical protein [Vulcanococcus limneticus Candia 3B3]